MAADCHCNGYDFMTWNEHHNSGTKYKEAIFSSYSPTLYSDDQMIASPLIIHQ